MNIGLWVLQVLLAALFGMAGAFKLFTPIEELARQMSWVDVSSPALARFIGASEIAGAIGLILPAATRIFPRLTPLAAAALALVMVLAAGTHVLHNEMAGVAFPAVLGLLSGLVAWGRWVRAPIAPRA